MYKSDLADAAGVSRTTFWRWLKENNSHLAKYGVKPRSKMLPPRAVKWVCDEYGIDYPEAA
jgi:predicted DNA-binding transcriptional regulator AlpA